MECVKAKGTKTALFLEKISVLRPSSLRTTRQPLFYHGHMIGWVAAEIAMHIPQEAGHATLQKGVHIAGHHRLTEIGEILSQKQLFRCFNELFDVFTLDGHVLGQIDRGALPLLGMAARGVHMNGIVMRDNQCLLWVGHRAADKRLDPGKLDHLAAGGVPAGLSPFDTMIKEAAEEAGIPASLSHQAQQVGLLNYVQNRPEGLRRDTLYCYDLFLPEDFTPRPVDGEVTRFELMKLKTVLDLVRDTDKFKFNVNLVLIDFFIRHGLFTPHEAREIGAVLYQDIKLEPVTP
ncbi:NUDIX hydrolase [Acetobacteraceae bacterium EV16G]|uniref:NUDIX hydrolase n=1 Tax=Sorlinia euscelidii TaxID=3081148 RepID=A0ABU7U683_9PROT